MAVDTDKLHKLFMSGIRIADIAAQVGLTLDSCQTYISNERKRNPYAWPTRKGKKEQKTGLDETPTDYMHRYECTDCFVIFTIEDYEGIDHSLTVCPICHCDENIEDAGYGYFVKTKEPEAIH